ncbi:SMI1/KNR4 family protein [Nannocystis radixulma]|uniref:SMI1/KNR4 family protein n=1 Tax=Nannocystis radixulma TaxID=2995305 RepID=A0ABT5B232_9BACT|nr:SMI1/KNR4 family protein [Nannocystis radixulma]MDC0668160.1 SMI1/KNR4 family protein [Nannocystis radixulma]
MDIDTAIRHVADLWPEFLERIAGAADDEILALEEAIRRPLPRSYRSFLARMGGDDAGFAAGFGGDDFRLETLLAHYQRANWGVPRPLLLVGLNHVVGEAQVHTCLTDAPANDPRVVYAVLRGGVVDQTLPAAQSLGELVFRYGFCNFFAFRLQTEGWGQLLHPDEAQIARLERRLAAAGLARHPASEGYAAYFVSDGLVAHYTHAPGDERLILLVHGQEVPVRAVMNDLTRELGVAVSWIGDTVDQHSHLQADEESAEDEDEEYDEYDEFDDDDDSGELPRSS